MRKLISLALGLGVGSGIALVLVALFAPVSGKPLRALLRQSYDETMAEARLASASRQRELEAELAVKLGKPLLPGQPAGAVNPPATG
ncbi:MAG: YtxH domain-containing protein [bacterium]|nr:YtxH domain-containing protein [bacterium]